MINQEQMHNWKHSMKKNLVWDIKHRITDNTYWVVKQTKTLLGTLRWKFYVDA